MASRSRKSLHPRQTTSEAVAAALRAEILAGEYSPGERLRQDEVAARLGVSITPIREAFTLLRAEGLLRRDVHRGVQVFAPTESDLVELYEMRIALERLAVRHAASRVGEESLDSLERLVAKMDSNPDHDGYFAQNKDFHTQLYRAAGWPRLSDTVHVLRDASDVYLHLFVVRLGDDKLRQLRSSSDADHRAIVAACRAREADVTEELMETHLRRTLGAAIELLQA